MSTAKRSRQRQADASPSKRLKSSHVPAKSGLGFLVDEETRAGKKLDAKLTDGVSRAQANRVDESQAAVAHPQPDSDEEDTIHVEHKKKANEVIEISSAEESSELEEDDDEDENMDYGADDLDLPLQMEQRPLLTNGHVSSSEEEQAGAGAGAGDVEMEDADEPAEEPTFGEQLHARHPDPIDLQQTAEEAAGGNGALVPAGERNSVLPTAASLGTTLTQALKTNDKDLLESCFGMPDVIAIRATIQRLQSQQVAVLLERVSERIHRRPGRAGKLMIWVQWSLVIHGGYLANQPELMRKMKSLAQVTRERANGLQPLLHLKGKLDLLSAQLEARRNMQASSRAANEEDDEEGVLYIDGKDNWWQSDDEATDGQQNASKPHKRSKQLKDVAHASSGEESAGDDDLPNGFINGIEDDSSADGDEDAERDALIDGEAEEMSDDEGSSNDDAESVASSLEDDEGSDGEESEVEVKQPKPQTLNRKR